MPSLQKLLIATFAASCTLPVAADPMTAAVEAQFSAHDTDHDGRLSPQESAEGSRQMFHAMDVDHDGKVTEAELARAQPPGGKSAEGATELSAKEKIRMVDADGDGILTATEHAEGAKAMFALMDLDADGFVTRPEMLQGHEELLMKEGRR